MKPLIVLMLGGGQESVAILMKYVFDNEFRETYFQDKKLLVLMSNTGNEYPFTYLYIHQIVKPFCKKYGIEFYFITSDMGFHPNTWPSLQAQFERNNRVMSVAFPKSCTDNLKIKPCYNFLQDYIVRYYQLEVPIGKKAYYEYAKYFGRLEVIIGFAKGEESRRVVDKSTELFPELVPDSRPKWMQRTIEPLYLLIDIGFGRKDCQDYISSVGYPVPNPSNCMFCPYQNEQELVLLYRQYPEDWRTWVKYEEAKLFKDAYKDKNFGVKGEKSLEQTILVLNEKYKNVSTEELEEYRFSHGHCVKSKY